MEKRIKNNNYMKKIFLLLFTMICLIMSFSFVSNINVKAYTNGSDVYPSWKYTYQTRQILLEISP